MSTSNITENSHWKSKIIRFLTAQIISLFGSSLVQYAIIWHITLTTSSGSMMTIATVCGFLPQIAISLFAGVWIDRYNRKLMIMLADGMIAAATLLLAVLFLMGYQSVWLLFAILLVRSAGTGIQAPAVNAIIPQLVPKEKLMKVSGIHSTLTSLMMFLSPAVSGAILSVSNISATLFIDVITALIGIGIMLTLSVPTLAMAKPSQNSYLHDIHMGFDYLKQNPFVRQLLLFLVSVAILVSPSAFLTPLMVSRSFGAEVWRLTASEMVFSAGAALGGVLIATWGGFRNRMHTTTLAGLCYGVFMILLGVAPAFLVYLIFNFLIGVTMPCYSAPITVLIQERVEPQMHGRVFSLLQVANSCSLPLGMVIFGPMADFITVNTLLLCAGTAVVICSACAFLFWRRQNSGSITQSL